ncbi:MAG: hypothetical protein BWX50_00516 [Euryarchaeota archaeon ADurb.Bin009]|nr:MAG: hypothetical protein BWX50_00516 [Euryarchaeota archaeon ADurb.Bin009]
MVAELVPGPRYVAFLPEIGEDPLFLADLDVFFGCNTAELFRGHPTPIPRDREAPLLHEVDRLDRAEEEPLGVKPFAVPALLKRGSRRQVGKRVGAEERGLDRSVAPGRLPDAGEVLHPHLVVGQFVLVVHDRKEVLFPHVDRGKHVLAQLLEIDKVPLGEDTDQVLGPADPGFVAAAEDAEIVRAGLDNVSPFADVAVDEIPADKIRLAGKETEQGVEVEVFHVDLAPLHEVERLFRREPEAGSLKPPVPPLLVERASFATKAHPGSVECRQHVVEL